MNLYRGRVALDANGEAIVSLPSYFEALNTSFTYQLTSIGKPGASLFVKSEVENNTFVIAGGQPGQTVSWEVTAERNDIHLQKHPEAKVAEVQKTPAQAGKYFYPVDFGKSEKDVFLSNPLITKKPDVENGIGSSDGKRVSLGTATNK